MKLIDPTLPWYVITCRTGCEERAWLELRTGGFDAYFPRRRRKVFNRRVRIHRTVEDAALPGYVFLAGSGIDWGRLHDDRHFEHVGRPLRGADGPLRVPGAVVLQISIDEMAGKFDETGATKKANRAKLAERFPKGKKLRIGEGVFVGFEAVVEAVTAKDRIKALVNIFGRAVPAEFGEEELTAA